MSKILYSRPPLAVLEFALTVSFSGTAFGQAASDDPARVRPHGFSGAFPPPRGNASGRPNPARTAAGATLVLF